jgi:cell cycle sensor histidine kinase DivJ
MSLQPVAASPGGEVSTVIVVTRDVTARKAELVEIAAARDEALRVSRAKSAFLATMSHELRTPLNAIIGFSELLHRELLIKAREPKQAEYCRIIHQSGEHLLSLVKDLLDVSKIESGKFAVEREPFDVFEVATSAVETVRPLALSKQITLACDVPQDLPDMLADRRAVRQIVIHLVSNACKFTEPGGTVRVAARLLGSRIELCVSDTGIGISPENLVKLGRPFYQVDTRYSRRNEGAGLGLSIVRGLVELHNGEMTIESIVGKGSRFLVVLDADMPAGAQRPRSPAGAVDLHDVGAAPVPAETAAPAAAGAPALPVAAMTA